MSIDKLALALAPGLALGFAAGVACGGDGGGGSALDCPGANRALVGSCVYEDGSCAEYRGQIEAELARASCAEEPAGEFRSGACPTTAFAAGACTYDSEGKSVVLFQPTLTAAELQAACAERGGCYDGPGGGDGATCPGAHEALVGSCSYASGSCNEYRGPLAEAETREHCAAEPPGTYRTSACPSSAQVPGSCTIAAGDGSIVFYEPDLSSAELEEACGQAGGCYER